MTRRCPTRSTSTPRRAAFTLLELVLVMVIVCIAAAVVAPSLRNFGRGRQVRECAAQLMAVAGYARTQAIAEAVTYRLHLDAQAGRYWLVVDRGSGTLEVPAGEHEQEFAVPQDVRIEWDVPQSRDGSYVEFLPTGRVSTGLTAVPGQVAGDLVTIRMTDAQGNVAVVVCPSATELFQIAPAAAVAAAAR